jgi:hypothetical protein
MRKWFAGIRVSNRFERLKPVERKALGLSTHVGTGPP